VNNIPFTRYHLEEGDTDPTFPIFEKFRAQGVTDYVVSFLPYGREKRVLWADLPDVGRGVVSAYSTRRFGGFSNQELEYLEALTRPLAMCVKAATTHELAETVLNTYLGTYSGSQVLDGLVERGDGKLIDCALWYSDLRDSTALADKMPLDDFLGMVNDYFECAAGAVIDHGGEVLRFIGDAVIAIFPYEKKNRPLVNMARAAAATARETIARAKMLNRKLMGPDPS
jgi:adenylate cyclase